MLQSHSKNLIRAMRTHSSVLLQRTETLARYDFEQAIGYLEVWYPQTGETLLMARIRPME
jgi:hypothetical protein